MTRRRLHATALATILLTLIPLSVSAQRMTRRVFIRATDAAGAPVLDLTAADLRVTENGNPREVTRLALGKAPMRIVLLVDSSSAMSAMINNFRAGHRRLDCPSPTLELRRAKARLPCFDPVPVDNGLDGSRDELRSIA